MRAVEITLAIIFLVAAIPLTAVLFPTLSPLATSNASVNFVDKMNMTALNADKPASGSGVVSDAVYLARLAIRSLDAMIAFIYIIPEGFVSLGIIFGVHPVLLAFLGVGAFCIAMFAIWQIWKGDSFEGKR